MQKVLIIQSEMKRYRIPFFSALHAALRRDGIELTVAYSNSHISHSDRGDRAELPAPIGKKVKGWWFFNRLLYQPLWREIFASDLVIVGPEGKYLNNPALLILSFLKLKTIAFWGLGPNRYPDRSAVSEWIKRCFFTCVDWWFAYTPTVVAYLKQRGMPADRITNVQNASDSAELIKLIAEIPQEEVSRAKLALTGSAQAQVGFYCGMLAEIKAIPLLIETARLVKQKCPEFHLVLIGNGPERPWLENAIAGEDWLHYLGSKYGRESALYYKMADVFLLAGTAGLAIVDCFAAGLPLLVTDMQTHPPEISYIVDGENGRIAPHEAQGFANSIIEVLSSPSVMEMIREGARRSGAQYTMEAMVENFRSGVKECLARYNAASSAGSPSIAVSSSQR